MPPLPSLIRRSPSDSYAAAPTSAFEAETSAMIRRIGPFSENAVLWSAAVMAALALALMSVMQLDRIVTGSGKIVPTTGSIYLQPVDRAVVHEIKVQLGEVVKKGQVLATLDPTFATADLTQLQQQTASAKALVARLDAERQGLTYAPANADAYQSLQARYFNQRQNEYRQSLANFDAQIQAARSLLAGAQRDAVAYKERLNYASNVQNMEATLEAHGNGSKLKTLSATDSQTEMARLLAESQNTADQTRHQITSLQEQRQVFIDHWHSDVASQLVEAHTTLTQAEQNLSKAARVHQLISLTAPVDAIVLSIADASVGTAVDSQGAHPLFTLNPLTGPLEAQVNVATGDNEFLAPGQSVQMELDAYSYRRHGTAKGVIKSISEGSFTQDDDGNAVPPYFKTIVEITDTHLINVPAGFRLIPGMTLTADVLTGKRTLLSYLTEPLTRTGSEAMREP